MHVHLQTISQTVSAFFMCGHTSEVFPFSPFSFFSSVLNTENRSVRKQAYLFFRRSDFFIVTCSLSDECYEATKRNVRTQTQTRPTIFVRYSSRAFSMKFLFFLTVFTFNTLRTVEVILHYLSVCIRLKWAPVTAAWRPQTVDGGDSIQIWKVAANILTKQSQTADKG